MQREKMTENAKVLAQRALADHIYDLTLEAPQIAAASFAGAITQGGKDDKGDCE